MLFVCKNPALVGLWPLTILSDFTLPCVGGFLPSFESRIYDAE